MIRCLGTEIVRDAKSFVILEWAKKRRGPFWAAPGMYGGNGSPASRCPQVDQAPRVTSTLTSVRPSVGSGMRLPATFWPSTTRLFTPLDLPFGFFTVIE